MLRELSEVILRKTSEIATSAESYALEDAFQANGAHERRNKRLSYSRR